MRYHPRMPRTALPLVVTLLALSLACASEPEGGGGGGGGSSLGGAPDEGDEAGGGRARSPRGGKAGGRHDDREKAKRGGRPGRGDGGGGGDDDDAPAPEPEPEPEPADPQPDGFACYAEGVYRVCGVEGKANTCHDETASAGGPGSTRAEAERNAIEACDLHMDTLVSAADSGKGSAEVRKRCELARCDE